MLEKTRVSLTEARLLQFLDCINGARFSDIKRGIGIPDKTVWEVLDRTIKKGFVVKDDNIYRITDRGRMQLSTIDVKQMLQQANAQQTRLAEVPLAKVALKHLVLRKREAIDQIAFMKAESPIEKLRIGLSYAFFKKTLLSSSEREFVDKTIDIFLQGLAVSCYPPAQPEEAEDIGDAAFDAIKQALKNKAYFEKVLENKRFTLIISMDLSKLKDSEARSLLYWVFKR